MTLVELKAAGWHTFVSHKRVCRRVGKRFEFEPCGGITEVFLVSPDGVSAVGRSKCSIMDQFSRKSGVQRSIERAMAKIEKRRNDIPASAGE